MYLLARSDFARENELQHTLLPAHPICHEPTVRFSLKIEANFGGVLGGFGGFGGLFPLPQVGEAGEV
jgi:hypothetical protein